MKTKKLVSTAKRSAKKVTIAAATVAMCVNMGLSLDDTEAAKAAIRDIMGDMGRTNAKAVIVSMNPFGPEIA